MNSPSRNLKNMDNLASFPVKDSKDYIPKDDGCPEYDLKEECRKSKSPSIHSENEISKVCYSIKNKSISNMNLNNLNKDAFNNDRVRRKLTLKKSLTLLKTMSLFYTNEAMKLNNKNIPALKEAPEILTFEGRNQTEFIDFVNIRSKEINAFDANTDPNMLTNDNNLEKAIKDFLVTSDNKEDIQVPETFSTRDSVITESKYPKINNKNSTKKSLLKAIPYILDLLFLIFIIYIYFSNLRSNIQTKIEQTPCLPIFKYNLIELD
mmetsp:Transcript_1384/g.1321  ORF Transcript_1384/g.1321 Transcript_1384/m.1321 type:complete len:264 (+) Transcript_1384:55-846(+)